MAYSIEFLGSQTNLKHLDVLCETIEDLDEIGIEYAMGSTAYMFGISPLQGTTYILTSSGWVAQPK